MAQKAIEDRAARNTSWGPRKYLDVLDGSEPGTDLGHDHLEAIIHKIARPAYIVENGSFNPEGEWKNLGQAYLKKIFKTPDLGEAKSHLEALMEGGGKGGGLDNLRIGSPDDNETFLPKNSVQNVSSLVLRHARSAY